MVQIPVLRVDEEMVPIKHSEPALAHGICSVNAGYGNYYYPRPPFSNQSTSTLHFPSVKPPAQPPQINASLSDLFYA